ncbi:unnamed protein product [Lampetra planeri]
MHSLLALDLLPMPVFPSAFTHGVTAGRGEATHFFHGAPFRALWLPTLPFSPGAGSVPWRAGPSAPAHGQGLPELRPPSPPGPCAHWYPLAIHTADASLGATCVPSAVPNAAAWTWVPPRLLNAPHLCTANVTPASWLGSETHPYGHHGHLHHHVVSSEWQRAHGAHLTPPPPGVANDRSAPAAACKNIIDSNIHNTININTTTTTAATTKPGTVAAAGVQRRAGHPCPICGKLYTRRYGLRIHVRTHTGHKPLRCAVCQRRFGDPSNLNKHVRLHGGRGHVAPSRPRPPPSPRPRGAADPSHRCHVCGVTTKRRRDLARHVRARHAPGVPR